MHRAHLLATLSLAAAIAVLAPASDATACGACFAPPTDDTQVSGHRMVLSVSTTATTLYDQLSYTGNPSSFAWVLPIRGDATVGLSANLLFETLESDTSVQVQPPPYTCPGPPDGCYSDRFGGGDLKNAPSAGSGGSGGGLSIEDAGVTVKAEATVGPYETVQLSATDPAALTTWLSDHGYAIPADMQPVIAAYVSEKFDFLALKLVPGQGVTAMRPVRVTTKGASAVLPLRMVAGGAGAKVPITLWVVGEAAYETQNFETFRIDDSALVYDYAVGSSNYRDLRDDAYKLNGGSRWLEESAIELSPYAFRSSVTSYVQMGNTEYAPSDASADAGTAFDAASADLDVVFAGMDPTSVRVTRLRAELPRSSLGVDLFLKAATDQTDVPRLHVAPKALNQPPCPDYSWCKTAASKGADDVVNTLGGDTGSKGLSCNVQRRDAQQPDAEGGLFAIAVAALGCVIRRRRSSRREGAER